jgi:hypothetical protein
LREQSLHLQLGEDDWDTHRALGALDAFYVWQIDL